MDEAVYPQLWFWRQRPPLRSSTSRTSAACPRVEQLIRASLVVLPQLRVREAPVAAPALTPRVNWPTQPLPTHSESPP